MILSDNSNQQKSQDFKICCDHLDANSNPQSSFSIRDYVFDSRSKNVTSNWPFPHKTLQICLQHEVKNILPPFESLESLRTNSSNKEMISSCNGKLMKSQTHNQQGLGQTKSKKPVLGCSRKAETETAAMGSKICPVCKVFSSSSNTTLNAHIDQCLSGESTMKWPANPEEVIKHRIKPRKTRLMVDIYKTALHCTVEDLDARNGTSWANDSSFPDQEIEFQGEHDVYVDSNRTKVRIFSVPEVDNSNNNNKSNKDGARKKRGKFGKVFLGKKKSNNLETKHDQKYVKQSPNSKKSSSEVAADADKHVGECRDKEAVDKDDLPIVRPPCKRIGLVEKNLSVACDKSFTKSGFKPLSSSSNKTEIIMSQQNSRKIGTLTPNKAKKRSLLSTKQSSILHNSCEDPSDSCRVNGSNVRSKGSKLSSKINPKRKFSALKRYQDSLKLKIGLEEDISGKTSCDGMNLLETEKNEKVETCRLEYPVSSRSLNKDSSCGVESVRNETRSHKEQGSSMQVPRSSDNMFDSRERVINDIETHQKHYHDMSDSPISTISNPSLTRSDSDKFSVRSTPQNDEKYALKGQSQSQSFKNDHQPCCCTRKEVAQMFSICNFPTSPPSQVPSPPPFKPVIRLMGKNLTVVNTDEDKVNCGQYPNGFKSQHSIFPPLDSLKNHDLETMFQSTTYAESPHVSPIIPALAFNNGSFQACSSFMNNNNLANWKLSMGR